MAQWIVSGGFMVEPDCGSSAKRGCHNKKVQQCEITTQITIEGH